MRGGHAAIELNVAPQVELVGDIIQIPLVFERQACHMRLSHPPARPPLMERKRGVFFSSRMPAASI
jgi:hypothetical protein